MVELEHLPRIDNKRHLCAFPLCQQKIISMCIFCPHHGSALPQSFTVHLYRMQAKARTDAKRYSLQYHAFLDRCIGVIRATRREKEVQNKLPLGLG